MLSESRLKYKLRVPPGPRELRQGPLAGRVRLNNMLTQSRLKYKLLKPWINPVGEFHGIKLSNNMLYLKSHSFCETPAAVQGKL